MEDVHGNAAYFIYVKERMPCTNGHRLDYGTSDNTSAVILTQQSSGGRMGKLTA